MDARFVCDYRIKPVETVAVEEIELAKDPELSGVFRQSFAQISGSIGARSIGSVSFATLHRPPSAVSGLSLSGVTS